MATTTLSIHGSCCPIYTRQMHYFAKNMYEKMSAVSLRQQKQALMAWALAITLVLAFSTTTNTMSAAAAASSSSSDTIGAICRTTLYPDACNLALASAASKPMTSRKELLAASVQFAMGRAQSAHAMAYNLSMSNQKPRPGAPSGMDDCVELLDISLDQLAAVLNPGTDTSSDDVRTWLSAALTNQVTCAESLETVAPSGGRDAVSAQVQGLSQFLSTALALHAGMDGGAGPSNALSGGHHRRLLSVSGSSRFPAWVSAGDRRLLESSPGDVRADAVVAKDGSGTHRTIEEAIEYVTSMAAAGGGGGRSVVYVKAGTYEETVRITSKQRNVMLMGDGKGASVIVGHRSYGDGYSTYDSATVAAMGNGFIAKGLTIINNAGPAKHQAVALRVGSDLSVVYQCSLQGYQDTLYTLSNRQFYTDTDIYGTVDFIFGNSAAVLQNCYIQPRKPGSGQKNTVTAQGRTDPNQNTGISIHRSRIVGAADLGSTPTYLGRPWQKYSRTVVMSTYLDGSIGAAGWLPWSGGFAESTCYYGEYGNTGPGSSVSGRAQWTGVHPSMSASEAAEFTVGSFILGDSWLPGSGVSYVSGL